MTKDEMRTAALEANNENDHIYYRNGFFHGFDAGYDAAMSRTCEWVWNDGALGYEWACDRDQFWDQVPHQNFCPNCGGRVVVKEAK